MNKWDAICLLLLILFLLVGIAFIWGQRDQRKADVCYDAGYTEVRVIHWTWYCIGVRDGQSVMVPLSEVEVE